MRLCVSHMFPVESDVTDSHTATHKTKSNTEDNTSRYILISSTTGSISLKLFPTFPRFLHFYYTALLTLNFF